MVKQGYKQIKLGMVVDILNGDRGVNYPSDNDFVTVGVPFINAGHIKNNTIDLSKVDYISENHYKIMGGAKLKCNDILFCLRGSLGKHCIVKFNDGAPASSLCAIRCHSINSDFVNYWLDSDLAIKQIVSSNSGSSQPNLSAKDVSDFLISFPVSYNEQQKIADYLASIDELISNQEKLIEKKKAIKQGVMQELLTGKKRLEGFCDEWQEYQVGNIGDFYSGLSGKSKSDFDGGNSNYITFLNVLENSIINIRELQKVQINNGESQNKVEYGDLFFNTSSETPEEVGMCSALLDEIDNTYLNSFCFGYRLKTDKISPLFLSYYFNSEMGRKIMINLAQGATRYNLSKNNFSEVKIFLPCRNEQDAISNILFDMEQEITEQEQKLEKYKQLKQAMMEQLLTGKIRLV